MDFTGERLIPEHNSESLIYGEHLARYVFAKQFVQGKKVLDVASGSGYGSALLADSGATEVFGVDISEDAVEYSKNQFARRNLHFLVGNAETLDFEDGSFDVVVSFETIEHLNDYPKFLKEVRRVLKKEGLLVISTPNKGVYPPENPFHTKEFTDAEFREIMSECFPHCVFKYQDNFVNNAIYDRDDVVKNGQLVATENIKGKKMYLLAICGAKKPDSHCKNINFITSSEEMMASGWANALEDRLQWGRDLERQLKERTLWAKSLEKDLAERTTWAKGLEKDLAERTAWAKGLEKDLAERTAWAKGLEKDLAERTAWAKGLEKDLAERTLWAQGLEKDLAERTLWAQGLEKDLESANGRDALLKEEVELYEGKITALDAELAKVVEKQAALNLELKSRDLYIDDRHYEIQCLKNVLGQKESRILAIEGSYSYKFGRALTWPIRILFPLGRKTSALLSVFLRFFHHPVNFLKHLKWGIVKNFFISLKDDDIELIESKLDNCLGREVAPESTKNEFSGSDKFEIFEGLDTGASLVFKYEKAPVVSIVIPVYNNWDLNYACLYSILQNTACVSYEVIIADDLSNDETKNIEEVVKNIVVVRHKENLRFLKNCNEAAKVARGKYIVFLNNDTNVQKGWLESLVELIERDDKIGMVGSKLVYPNGQLQEAGGIIWKEASGWNYGRFGNPDLPEYNYVKEVDYISGAAIMIRAELWNEIGGFDELYVPAYYEDSDLAFEVRKRGYKVLYQPKSVVVHFEGMSHGTDSESGLKAYQVENKIKFFNKWRDVLQNENFSESQDVFLARDKNKGNKTILVIDHYVPTYDKDAGSRTMFQYLKLLLDMGLNVKFLGDNFAKMEPYTDELMQMGIEVLYGPWYQNHWQKWIQNNSKYLDYVYLNRAHIAIKYIDFIKENTNAKILYNAVDFSFLREERQYEVTGDSKYWRAAQESRKREFEVFGKSDVVLTISEFEKDFLNKEMPGKNVRVMPTFIYDSEKLPKGRTFDDRNGITFVGGFIHTPNVDAVIWFVKNIFPELQKVIKDVVFNIIGSNPTDDILALKSTNINVTGFVTDAELEKYYAKSKLVVAPLRFGAGVKGKILEAIAHGLPVVSTTIGVEGIRGIEGSVKVADTPDEFVKAIVSLYNEGRAWRGLNLRGQSYIKDHLSKDCARCVIEGVL